MGSCLRRTCAAAAVLIVLFAQACGGGGAGGTGSAGSTSGTTDSTSPGTDGDARSPGGTPPAQVVVRVSELASGLASPWGLAFLPDGRMLVTERAGTLRLLAADGALVGSVSGAPAVAAEGQGGLLDVALDPAFVENRLVYLSLSERDGADPALSGTAVARAVLSPDALSLSQLTLIYRQSPKVASTAHFGSRLVFDASGHLFVTLGDRNERDYAQDLARGHGKVARITTAGAPAPGNPAWTTAGAQPHTWTYGHRNVQGAALHPVTGELWVSEHGPQGGDEVNRLQGGRNYGWPLASSGQEYATTTPVGASNVSGTEPPAWAWHMADGSAWSDGRKSSVAPAGAVFYTATSVPQWQGNLFVGSLAGQALWRLSLDGNTVTAQERLLAARGQRIRDVEQGPDGALYLLTDDGKLLRYGP